VLPYMNPDLMDARRLKDAGAAAVMPLGAPIGTNKGLKTREMIKILIDEIDIPVIVDAGIASLLMPVKLWNWGLMLFWLIPQLPLREIRCYGRSFCKCGDSRKEGISFRFGSGKRICGSFIASYGFFKMTG